MAESYDITEWDGVIGPQSEYDPIFYELEVDADTVRLVGPSPGQLHEYELEEFETLVAEGEWVLADHDPDDGSYQTPDGTSPF